MGIKKLKLAVFISGRGSNMHSIYEATKDADYPAEISVVVSNRPDAAGLEFAKDAGIPTELIDHRDFDSREDFDDEVNDRLRDHDVDLIVLAGFLRILSSSFIEKWPDQIINIHPSLLPAYKGLNTHERAINDGQDKGGCTVHFVNEELDSGPIILQKEVPIIDGDTPEALAERVLEQEHIAYPEAIKIIAQSRV